MLGSTPSRWRPRGHPYPHIIYMAHSKSFFGLRRGSTKTLTFSVYNGKQVTKDRVTDVKNPRSSAQMMQRAIMATALHGYSALKEICDHSFEGVTYGQRSMNYFVAENARMIRSAAPDVNLSTYKGIAVSNAYIIAKGSLPSIELMGKPDESYFTLDQTFTGTFTFAQLMAAFGGSMIGDMVTFVALVDNPGTDASVYWLRLKLTEGNKTKSFTVSESKNIVASLSEGTDFETNIDNFSANDFSISYLSNENKIAIAVSNEEKQSMGVIVSRKSDTGWLRSSSTMVNIQNTFNYAEALASYPESGDKILNGGNV